MKELRDDQKSALDELRSWVREGVYHLVMQAPTGYGKTLLAAALIGSARSKNKKVLFTVPAISLIDQTVQLFYSQGITDVGVIQADHPQTDWSKPVQVASVQTLIKREIPDADVILIDEVHKWFQLYEKLLCDPQRQKQPIIGLSATPWTKGLGKYFGHTDEQGEHVSHLVVASTTEQLIADGRLSPFKVFAPSHPDLNGVRISNGDYAEDELAERMDTPKLVADVVDTWLKQAEGRPTLCFAVNRVHAAHLAQKFEAAGVTCAYQDAFTKPYDRTIIKQRFHSGEIKVVCNIGTLTTGVDWDVRCISMARPTRSEMLFVQIVGRGLRTAEGKDHCLILDHSDNHLRMGFVTDVDARHCDLHDGKTRAPKDASDAIRLPKECPQCAFLKPPRMAKCPNCGFVAVAQNDIEEAEGELTEFKREKPENWPFERKLEFMAMLKAYGIYHKNRPGAAIMRYIEKFKVTKIDRRLRDVPPAETWTDEVEGWVQRCNFAYRARKRKEEMARNGAHPQHEEMLRTWSGVNGTHSHVEPQPSRHVPGTLMTEDDLNVDL